MRALLVPVKSFRRAKLRLAGVLDEEERGQLARELAEIAVAAAHGMPVYVVCDDGEVADWAVTRGRRSSMHRDSSCRRPSRPVSRSSLRKGSPSLSSPTPIFRS